jgi:phosphatidylinositol 3-kinase
LPPSSIFTSQLSLSSKFDCGHHIFSYLPTKYQYFSWNEWINLPLKYKDLPRSAQVALTIWDVYGPRKALLVGGTTVSLFGKSG